jgi:hypothetical protein
LIRTPDDQTVDHELSQQESRKISPRKLWQRTAEENVDDIQACTIVFIAENKVLNRLRLTSHQNNREVAQDKHNKNARP